MLNSVCMALCKRIPAELNIDASIQTKIKLFYPYEKEKQPAAIVKVDAPCAYNT